ncbi:N-methylhydantoinase A/oxoprolinase/acetone carboxylase beta subunit [Methanolinea mesophila]|uniref:hydantoinase/oxoprolinase family protein n=1 Tax=Methanolinea mesophila TaxID=547055 RepID=UPI001AEAC69C|nr:hydantoinase/oxoprolinase family protein [Methanolinea mesophila]MBP1927546.1 N-methylhydantoinase A/oxoprolinase/acetone carboxylase beta subunit [Methanolinea mesophila]
MLTGVDIGGTNTDVVTIDGTVRSQKVPNHLGLDALKGAMKKGGRLAVSTSQPLNLILAGTPPKVATIAVPGPGLTFPRGVSGAVNHRGEVVEPLDSEEVREAIRSEQGDVLAVAAKFSVRNPALELEILDIALQTYPDERIALSCPLGMLNFPARVATTKLNAQIKETVSAIASLVGGVHPGFLFFKGDGGLATPATVRENPALLYQSSNAAVALGAYYLTGVKDCVVVDIGGTTTDLVVVRDGKPVMKPLVFGGVTTLAQVAEGLSIPYGGDSQVRGGVPGKRAGNARAFGGEHPTLTDALNVMGAGIGNSARSAVCTQKDAETALDWYARAVIPAVREFGCRTLVGTGYLAPWLLPRIAGETGCRAIIPEHGACANAVGVAVSRFSLTLSFRLDTGKKTLTVNGEPSAFPGIRDDDRMVAFCRQEARDRALKEGADPRDVRVVDVLGFASYNVVRGSYRTEYIADCVVQVEPGITAEAR